jgi:hypothetical protein
MAVRQSRKPRKCRFAKDPFRPILEPREARVLPTFLCVKGSSALARPVALSTHLIGDSSRALLGHSIKPVALLRIDDGMGGSAVTTCLVSDLVNAADSGRFDPAQLRSVPQGEAAYQAAAIRLGVSAPYTSTATPFSMTPQAGGGGGGQQCAAATPPVPPPDD